MRKRCGEFFNSGCLSLALPAGVSFLNMEIRGPELVWTPQIWDLESVRKRFCAVFDARNIGSRAGSRCNLENSYNHVNGI